MKSINPYYDAEFWAPPEGQKNAVISKDRATVTYLQQCVFSHLADFVQLDLVLFLHFVPDPRVHL